MDFSCILEEHYASLRAVSNSVHAHKYLKTQYLKKYFKFMQGFPQLVENPVEKVFVEAELGAFTMCSMFPLNKKVEGED